MARSVPSLLAVVLVPAALALGAAAVGACSSSVPGCATDYDCDGTDLCKVSTGKCVALASVACRLDAECVDPAKVCRDLECVRRCAVDADCLADAPACVDHACMTKGQGGPDAGP